MRVWNQSILATAKGKTAGTYDSIGTITIRKGASSIHGFYSLIVLTKPTDNEASAPILRLNSSELGISNMLVTAGTIGSEGNSAAQGGYKQKVWNSFSPVGSGKAIEFATIAFEVSSVVACTEGWDCGIQFVTGNAPPTPEMQANYKANACGVWSDSSVAIESAGAGNSAALAGWGDNDADKVIVNAKNSSIVGIDYSITLNTETNDVPLCNYAELTCSDIPDFTPQQHLVGSGSAGTLGTVIDSIHERASHKLPFVFDGLPRNKVKIAIADINSLTGLGAGEGILGMVFK